MTIANTLISTAAKFERSMYLKNSCSTNFLFLKLKLFLLDIVLFQMLYKLKKRTTLKKYQLLHYQLLLCHTQKKPTL